MTIVRDIAHSRAGDKGATVNVSAIAFDAAGYARLERELTAARAAAAFAPVADGPVRRYALPQLRALNFVVEGMKGGGVTRTLCQDLHGKSLSSLLLAIPLPGNRPDRDAASRRPVSPGATNRRSALRD